jgi:hypothetical protein
MTQGPDMRGRGRLGDGACCNLPVHALVTRLYGWPDR